MLLCRPEPPRFLPPPPPPLPLSIFTNQLEIIHNRDTDDNISIRGLLGVSVASLLVAALPTKTPASLSAATARSIAAKGSRVLFPSPAPAPAGRPMSSQTREPSFQRHAGPGALAVCTPPPRQPSLALQTSPCPPGPSMAACPTAPSLWHYGPLQPPQRLLPCSGEREPQGGGLG